MSPSAPDAPYLARHVALRCGLPVPTPALIGNNRDLSYYKRTSVSLQILSIIGRYRCLEYQVVLFYLGYFLIIHFALTLWRASLLTTYFHSVNRLCGSGFQSIVNGVQEILVGDSEVVLTGGTDNMSASPYAVRDIR